MRQYDHKKVEQRWQSVWARKKIYKTKNPPLPKAPADAKALAGRTAGQGKYYVLDMFPYPSGEGLHVGHPKGYIATDVISRMKRMQGFNVLHPMGFDAFGLPAENYAIKTKTNPVIAVAKNVARYKKQLKLIGLDYDWSREVNTTDPKYYKWTQWIFLKLLEKGLAYESNEPVNWCPKDKTVLANEDVEGGRCERCGTVVEKKSMRQWVLKITDYADRMLADLDLLDWPESIKESQRNWIGRSEGVNFKCKIKDLGIEVEMYNSVPQTYRAETFTVIAPDHALVPDLVKGTKYEKPVLDFVKHIEKRKLENRFETNFDPEGIFTGRYVENYAGTGRDLPIWVASYVLADYGTGIANASAHDERDVIFAKKYNIPLHPVAEALFVDNEGLDAVRKDKPLVEREAILAIVKHWSEDKYLGLKWKKVSWGTFISGGVEKGQTPEQAARAEIEEETGYFNLKLVKDLGRYHSKFYHTPKDENRFGHFSSFYFELQNGNQKEISEAEKEKHDIVWLEPKEVASFLTVDSLRYRWDVLKGIEKPIIKNGILTEPAEFRGREWNEVRNDIIDYIVKNGWGKRKTNYKLRDWVFSRQRYWGEPIPVFHDGKVVIPVKEKDLPVKLPPVKSYEPTGTGESPLAGIAKWINVPAFVKTGAGKKVKKILKRESNTMPQWAGSSWYYLRYMDPRNDKALVGKDKQKYWNVVDLYVGGAEHATRHLIYARFWHKFLYDIGAVSYKEPFQKLQSVGLIQGADGRKMSKRFGNVVNPDDIIATYGADTLRLYEMFMGPFEGTIPWSTDNIVGCRRFLERVWKFQFKIKKTNHSEVEKVLNKTIKKVTGDIAAMRFNTAISSMMIMVNTWESVNETIPKEDFEKFLQILAPFAPHITEEIWSSLGHKTSIHLSAWPSWDENLVKDEEVKIAVQVNGKVRAEIMIQSEEREEEVKKKALADQVVRKYVAGKNVKRAIYVKGRLINIVL